ncbi:MAG: Xylulose kinase [Chloroflexi bacterium ADurb.Bin325]|nr:MAG: Xylulose kinase [Chloroflexi bacterium ADurb.Bin325]
MSDRYILTIDIGTSSTKTALWTAAGARVASAACDYALTRSRPAWAEIDAREWWRAACRTTRQVLAEAHVPAQQVAGVGVDGLSWTLLPVDAGAEPLAPALIWLDRRADEAAALRRGPHTERLVELSANPLDPAYITPKLLWLKAQRPDIFEATHAFLTSSGYLTARLTGELTCDFTQAYGYHFFDMAAARWDAAALALLGVPAGKLPRLCPPGEVVGHVTRAAAEASCAPARRWIRAARPAAWA